MTLAIQRNGPLERNINAVFMSVFVAGLVNAFFESWMFSVGNLTSLMFWAPTAGVVARWAWRTAPVSHTEQVIQVTHRAQEQALVGQR